MSDVPTGGSEPLEPLDPNEPEILDPNDPDFEEPPEPIDGDEPPEPDSRAPDEARRTRPGEAARWRQRYEELLTRTQTQPVQQPQQPYIDPYAQQRAEQEWFQQLQQMDPATAYQALWGRAQQQMQQALFLQNAQTTDRIDKTSYESLARTHKVYRDYQPAVERELAAARARMDYTTTREDIFHRLLGRDAADRAINAVPAQRRQGAARVAAQATRPPPVRGDIAPTQAGRRTTSQDAADEALLRGLTTEDI